MALRYKKRRGVSKPSARAVGVAASGGFSSTSSYSMTTGTPDIRDPLFSPEGFYITNQDIKTYNRWIRYYDAFHPILPNSLDIHSLFPISDFSFKGIEDPFVSKFYTFVKDDVLSLLDWVILVSTEYERLGEAFSFFQWDTYNGYFNTATILNPDLLEIYPFEWDGSKRFVVSMDIPETFQVLYDKKGVDSRYRGMWLSLDPVIRRCVESGLPIPLNPDNVFGMQRLQHAYDVRGTSQVLRVLKDLMYEDKLREAQMAVADGHITPYQLWKIGNSQQGYVPTEGELAEWDKMLANAEHQNLFRIVTHSDVAYETKGVSEGLLNITGEMEKIEDRILTALYTSRSMTTGEGPCVSADTEVLTASGFKPFPEVTVKDLVASVNPSTHEIEYCYPKEVLCFDVEGPMFLFKNNALDHKVTPNHRCFVKTSPKKPFEILRAELIKGHHRFMTGITPFKGQDVSEIKIGNRAYPIEDYLKLVGLYLSEGNIDYSKSKNCAGVCITQTKQHKKGLNPRFLEISEALLKFSPHFYFSELKSPQGSKGRFRLYDPELAKHIVKNYGCGSLNKKIPLWVKALSSPLLENLLEGCFLGDGSFTNKTRSSGGYEIYTISKALADSLQEVALKCGKVSIIKLRKRPLPRKDLYRVRIYCPGDVRKEVFKYPSLGRTSAIKTELYKGKVYSLDLPPNRLYVSRRKGKITVTGNTYSNAVIGLKVLEGRYQNKLYRISSTIRSLFKKIAYANDFYETTQAELSHGVRRSKKDRKLLVPMVHWDNYFSFSKDIERAKFYQTLAQAHKISWRRVLEILGLDFDEERKILAEDMKTIMDTDVYKQKITDFTGKEDPYAGGSPTDLSSPPSPGEVAMEDVGAEVMEDVGAPPLPDIDV